MASDSWEAFVGALTDETQALALLKELAGEMTRILIGGEPTAISVVERKLDGQRIAYARTSSVRRGMQARGFGQMTLRQVCAYAPRPIAAQMGQRLAELSILSLGVGLTVANNKALIESGMERLIKVTGALQKANSDDPGTYRRRGFVPPPRNSVLVSSSA
jgi:hypothetical protein